MTLADIAEHYGERFLEKYQQKLLPGHKKALHAIRYCRTPAAGMTLLECTGCQQRDHRPIVVWSPQLQPLPEHRHQ